MKTDWLDEYIKDVPSNKKLYNFFKVFLFRKKGLKYKELYSILCNLYNKKDNTSDYKKMALNETLNVYIYNNGNLPKGINVEEDE